MKERLSAIEMTDLSKSYGEAEVLKGVNLEVEKGSLLALLGPNGAGKTTTVRILATLLRFNARMEKVLGLSEAARRQVKHYSGGMRRWLDISASLIFSLELLFLDEPTTGLDPRSRRCTCDVVRSLRATGTTVLLTTQYMEEADELANRIVIIDHGSIIADGSPGWLKTYVGSGILKIRLNRTEERPLAGQIVSQTLGIAAQREAAPAVLSAQISDSERLATTIAALSRSGIRRYGVRCTAQATSVQVLSVLVACAVLVASFATDHVPLQQQEHQVGPGP